MYYRWKTSRHFEDLLWLQQDEVDRTSGAPPPVPLRYDADGQRALVDAGHLNRRRYGACCDPGPGEWQTHKPTMTNDIGRTSATHHHRPHLRAAYTPDVCARSTGASYAREWPLATTVKARAQPCPAAAASPPQAVQVGAKPRSAAAATPRPRRPCRRPPPPPVATPWSRRRAGFCSLVRDPSPGPGDSRARPLAWIGVPSWCRRTFAPRPRPARGWARRHRCCAFIATAARCAGRQPGPCRGT